jgi:hypothetical protein
LFYAAIIGATLLVIVLAGAFFGIRYARGVVNDFTDTKPAPLPQVQMSEHDSAQLESRIDAFRDAVQSGQANQPLTLSADDINALIQTKSGLESLKGQLYVTINGSQLSARISAPAEQLGLPLHGRYVNADGTFAVALKDDQLIVTAESLTAKGRPLPEAMMRQLGGKNLAENINNDPSVKRGLRALKDIQVKDGKLILVPKAE